MIWPLSKLDQFDQSNGFQIHHNRGPIKKRGSNLILDGQDGKFEIKYAEFYGDQIQSLNGSDWTSNLAHKDPMVTNSPSILVSLESGPNQDQAGRQIWSTRSIMSLVHWVHIYEEPSSGVHNP